MVPSLSAPDSLVSPEFDQGQQLSNSSSKLAPSTYGVQTSDGAANESISGKSIKKNASSTQLDIPTLHTSTGPASTRTPTRSSKDKHEQNLPTIRMEGPSPTTNFSYFGKTSLKDDRNRRRRPWRKLMWVKQNYPDNYTDATFLDSLQRNVNFQAYDFWSLIYDSTVIIQHISTVVIFVCAFIAISLCRVQPVYMAGASTILTVIAWLIWDEWNEEEQVLLAKYQDMMRNKPDKSSSEEGPASYGDKKGKSSIYSSSATIKGQREQTEVRRRNGNSKSRSSSLSPENTNRKGPRSLSVASGELAAENLNPSQDNGSFGDMLTRSQTSPPNYNDIPPPSPPLPPSRANRRVSTLKSALLIYSTLLGLSPILKSLTKTTTSDSIWALSSWLFLVNLLCFDYGLSESEIDMSKKGADSLQPGMTGPNVGGHIFRKKLPTSLSTTTALTASVVLASRLTETADVFSLLLFSIQIFGLFPLFRRRLRYLSSTLHVVLTIALILIAGLALQYVLNWQWMLMWFGLVLGGGGGAAWALMGMQRYKNEIRGPWDPARPVFSRRQWME